MNSFFDVFKSIATAFFIIIAPNFILIIPVIGVLLGSISYVLLPCLYYLYFVIAGINFFSKIIGLILAIFFVSNILGFYKRTDFLYLKIMWIISGAITIAIANHFIFNI